MLLIVGVQIQWGQSAPSRVSHNWAASSLLSSSSKKPVVKAFNIYTLYLFMALRIRGKNYDCP